MISRLRFNIQSVRPSTQRVWRLSVSLSVLISVLLYCGASVSRAEETTQKTSPSSATASSTVNTRQILASGPLVGFGGISEVTLWAQTTAPAEVRFRYWPQDHPERAAWSASVNTSVAGHLIAELSLIHI